MFAQNQPAVLSTSQISQANRLNIYQPAGI
jgi:hypothetical protein